MNLQNEKAYSQYQETYNNRAPHLRSPIAFELYNAITLYRFACRGDSEWNTGF